MPIRIGVLGRTTIDADISFFVLIAVFVFMDQERWGWERALMWAPVLIISVLVHELAHAATIGAFGFGGSRILLLGIGGLTINQRHARPVQEMLISLAGPMSSFVIAIAGYLGQRVAHDVSLLFFCKLLCLANLYWGVL